MAGFKELVGKCSEGHDGQLRRNKKTGKVHCEGCVGWYFLVTWGLADDHWLFGAVLRDVWPERPAETRGVAQHMTPAQRQSCLEFYRTRHPRERFDLLPAGPNPPPNFNADYSKLPHPYKKA